MDSVTQFALGASIAGAMLGPRVGAKALLIGGIVGTLPDLDSFIPLSDPIDNMTYHRGFSHSVFVQTLVSPLVAFAIGKFVPATWEDKKRLFLTVWIILITHSLLDSLTTYGTQIFWPLNVGPPIALPAIFIIDPVYTLMLLAGMAAIFFGRKTKGKGLRANRVLLAASCAYLTMGLAGNAFVSSRAAASPQFQDMRIHVQPTPFNLLVWQVTGVSDNKLATGLTSLLHDCDIQHVVTADRSGSPIDLETVPDSVKRLEWFTDGFYSYGVENGQQTISDLRIGYYPSYPFSFKIAEVNGSGTVSIPPERIRISYETRAGDIFGLIGETLDGCN